jgi:hypothetical protein
MQSTDELIEVRKFICPNEFCNSVATVFIYKKSEVADLFCCRKCQSGIWINWASGQIFDRISKKKVDPGYFFLLEPDEY